MITGLRPSTPKRHAAITTAAAAAFIAALPLVSDFPARAQPSQGQTAAARSRYDFGTPLVSMCPAAEYFTRPDAEGLLRVAHKTLRPGKNEEIWYRTEIRILAVGSSLAGLGIEDLGEVTKIDSAGINFYRANPALPQVQSPARIDYARPYSAGSKLHMMVLRVRMGLDSGTAIVEATGPVLEPKRQKK